MYPEESICPSDDATSENEMIRVVIRVTRVVIQVINRVMNQMINQATRGTVVIHLLCNVCLQAL